MNKQYIVMGPKSRRKREQAKTLRHNLTEAEVLLWERVRRSQCGGLHFRRQQIIDGFITDFYCHAAGLIIEVDGGVHTHQVDYDRLRERILLTRGLKILRFTNERVLSDIVGVLDEIRIVATSSNGLSSFPNKEGMDAEEGEFGK